MHRRIVAIALGTFAVCGCGSPTQTESQTSSATPPVAGSAADPDGRRRTPPAGDADAGTAPVATGFGDPLQGLTAAERASFDDGKVHFATAEELEEGLGPVLNEASCVACHAGQRHAEIATVINRIVMEASVSGSADPVWNNRLLSSLPTPKAPVTPKTRPMAS